MEPPGFRPMPGRPKKNRRKDKDEVKKTAKLTRAGRTMTCKICNNKGHNARGYPIRGDSQVTLDCF